MGKFDRRNSLKMKRRKAQVKKKSRALKVRSEQKVRAPGVAAKKTPKKKAAPPPAAE